MQESAFLRIIEIGLARDVRVYLECVSSQSAKRERDKTCQFDKLESAL